MKQPSFVTQGLLNYTLVAFLLLSNRSTLCWEKMKVVFQNETLSYSLDICPLNYYHTYSFLKRAGYIVLGPKTNFVGTKPGTVFKNSVAYFF